LALSAEASLSLVDAPYKPEACADLADHVNLCAGGDEWACFGWAEAPH
jgi:hypothetical protein